jgi:hypothetical protein
MLFDLSTAVDKVVCNYPLAFRHISMPYRC